MEFSWLSKPSGGTAVAVGLLWLILLGSSSSGSWAAAPSATITSSTTTSATSTNRDYGTGSATALNYNSNTTVPGIPLLIKPSGTVTSGRRWDLNETAVAPPARISSVITAQSGDTAFLPCHVPLREEHGVSWVRRRDWYILTADSKVYSRDERVRVSFVDSPEHTWTLLIKYIRKEDEGIYDCQITTRRGAWTQSVELRVVEPLAVLVGAEDVYVGVGSPFTITCVITNTLKPPEYVQWSVDSKPLNFGIVGSHNSQHSSPDSQSPLSAALLAVGSSAPAQSLPLRVGGGHSVTFDPGPPSVSRLAVHSATATDSGRYTCQPSSGLPASTQVHVALGNEMAAIQAADAAGRDGPWRWLLLAASLSATLLLNFYRDG